MEDILITSNELLKMNNFDLPKYAKDFSNYTFWYYTSIHTANLILKNKTIHVSNISLMNDVDEKEIHQSDNNRIHCLCLCNSNTEKIPMWYLYSGISGKGVSIGFTPSVLLGLITSIDTVSSTDGKTILKKGKDFDIDYGWIFYRKKEKTSQILYKRKWYSIDDPTSFETDNYFLKSYPWEYEKEFRIVIKNKTDKTYDRLAIDITPIYSKLKIKLAPEISNENFQSMLPNLSGFSMNPSLKIMHSNLGINMNLCKRNIESFLEYLDLDMKTSHEIDISKIKAVFDSSFSKD